MGINGLRGGFDSNSNDDKLECRQLSCKYRIKDIRDLLV